MMLPFLLSMADDDFIIGYRDSEWTGIAPMLEEDVAMSSLSQDEIGHAKVLYELASDLSGRSVNELAYGRELGEYRSSWLVEHHRRDWAFTIARRYLYETADDVRAEAAACTSVHPLGLLLAKIRREEKYHLLHLTTWLDRLAASEEARPRLEGALAELWPDALGFWERLEGEDELVRAGVMPVSSPELRDRWLSRVTRELSDRGLGVPQAASREGGRRGRRSAGFADLWDEMTEVYRADPAAVW